MQNTHAASFRRRPLLCGSCAAVVAGSPRSRRAGCPPAFEGSRSRRQPSTLGTLALPRTTADVPSDARSPPPNRSRRTRRERRQRPASRTPSARSEVSIRSPVGKGSHYLYRTTRWFGAVCTENLMRSQRIAVDWRALPEEAPLACVLDVQLSVAELPHRSPGD